MQWKKKLCKQECEVTEEGLSDRYPVSKIFPAVNQHGEENRARNSDDVFLEKISKSVLTSASTNSLLVNLLDLTCCKLYFKITKR